APRIVGATERVPPLGLRGDRGQQSRDAYRALLAEAGIATEIVDGLRDGLRLEVPVPVASLPGFATGAVSVQDGAAQRVADALAPAPGARVLDACAAPGGKAAHLLEREPALQLTA